MDNCIVTTHESNHLAYMHEIDCMNDDVEAKQIEAVERIIEGIDIEYRYDESIDFHYTLMTYLSNDEHDEDSFHYDRVNELVKSLLVMYFRKCVFSVDDAEKSIADIVRPMLLQRIKESEERYGQLNEEVKQDIEERKSDAEIYRHCGE